MNNKNPKVGRNLEEINEKNILNFGNLSREQSGLGIKVNWNESIVKCRRCNNLRKAIWESKSQSWNINSEAKGGNDIWKVYLFKTQVKKQDTGYYIVGGIEFYCPECDWRHNYWEKSKL